MSLPFDYASGSLNSASTASRDGLRMLAVEMAKSDFSDFQSVLDLFERPDNLECLAILCNTGLSNLDKMVKRTLSNMLVRSWGKDACLLRQALGLDEFMSLWEVSARFNDAMRVATLTTPLLQHAAHVGEAEIVSRQLDAIAEHTDYFRGMAQSDLQSVIRTAWQNAAFSGVLIYEAEESKRRQQQVHKVISFAFERIPNAAEIISISVMADTAATAGQAFCGQQWEENNCERWFSMLINTCTVDRNQQPSALASGSTLKGIILSTLVNLVPLDVLVESIQEPWQWQFAYKLTGNSELLELMPAGQREHVLASDLGL